MEDKEVMGLIEVYRGLDEEDKASFRSLLEDLANGRQPIKGYSSTMTEDEKRKGYNEYMRDWRRKNPQKVKESRERYIMKKGKELAARTPATV